MADVRVLWARADAPADLAARLSADERARMDRFRRPEDAAMFLAAHVLVRIVVAERVGVPHAGVELVQRCERCGGPHGRPQALVDGEPGPPTSFSHAGAHVVAAVGTDELGVDVEPLAGSRDGLAAAALSDGERALLERRPARDRADLVTRWWVRKEAVLKALGTGLDLAPELVEVSPPWEPPRVITAPEEVQLADLDLTTDLTASLATMGSTSPTVTVARWSW